jgi:hypothetical protein
MKSIGLAPWTKAKSPGDYIVQVVSGIYFGAALLQPSGRVLTWGHDSGPLGALGRTCGGTHPDDCSYAAARNPGFAEQVPPFSSIEASFTGIRGLTPTGELWGWSAKELAYCGGAYTKCDYTGLPRWPPVKVASNVRDCQTGQGYLLWESFDGKFYGIGYNVVGALGHSAFSGNQLKANQVRELIFFPKAYWNKTKSAIEKAIANGETRPYTLDECLRGMCL